MQSVIEVTGKTFRKEVLERSETLPVVVDFWSPTCGPCLILGPLLERLARESRGKWILAKVNTSDPANQTVAMDFRIQGIPSVKAFKDGKIVEQFAGSFPESFVLEWLQKFVPNEADDLAIAGKSALETGDIELAKDAFTKVLATDPLHPHGLLGSAEIAILENRVEDAKQCIGKIPHYRIDKVRSWRAKLRTKMAGIGKDIAISNAKLTNNPNDLDARLDRAAFNAANERYEDALEDLIFVVTINKEYKDEAARRAAVEIFETVGQDSEITTKWRKRLGRAMY